MRVWIDVKPGEYDQHSFEVSKKMSKLLRDDRSVLREDGECMCGASQHVHSQQVSKKMTKLLRDDRSVLREDGAVEFKILAPVVSSQFESSPHCPTWVRYLQRGGGPKKRFQYCLNPYSAETILYLRAIQGHSG